MGRISVVTHTGADSRHLVGRHVHAHATAADQDAALGTLGHQYAPDSLGKIGIVGRLGIVSANIDHLVTQAFQITADLLLERKTGVIGSHHQLHCYFPASVASLLRTRSTSALPRFTMLSTPKPSSSSTFGPGDDAPNRSKPITSPCRPTYFHQPSGAPASTASLGR